MDSSLQEFIATFRFPLLTTERYFNAFNTAKDQLKKHIQPPKMEQFKSANSNAYPLWFTVSILIALCAVLVFSFVISAGKQAAAMGIVLDHLPGKFNHLSTGWANVSIIFMMLMSELGAVLFLVAAGTIGELAPRTTLRRWKDKQMGEEKTIAINLIQWTFRGFAVLCAGYALVSNITITMLDPIDNVAGVLQWLMAIGIPLTVLGLGIMLERIVIDALKANTEQKLRFQKAETLYQAVLEDPTQHELFPQFMFDALYTEMVRLKAERLKLEPILPYVENDQDTKRWLVASEYQAHQQINVLSLEGLPTRFLSEVA